MEPYLQVMHPGVKVDAHLENSQRFLCGGAGPVQERGETSMEFLRKLDKEAVHMELERFQGVGKKTSVTRFFSLLRGTKVAILEVDLGMIEN